MEKPNTTHRSWFNVKKKVLITLRNKDLIK